MPILTQSALSIKLPKLLKVRQKFPTEKISDLEAEIKRQIYRKEVQKIIKPRQKIALAVGSRGISNLSLIVKTVVACLKNLGAQPFIVPAMGSHGGATAEGQREVLNTYGINEATLKAPVISSMEVVKLGETRGGIPVYFDKKAFEADLIVPVNRVKPHTDFKGEIESGLCKMLVIGLGKHEGCSRVHKEGFERFDQVIPEVAAKILKKAPIGFGIAILENSYEETALVKAIEAKDFLNEEPILLKKAKEMMPKILLPEIDVLIVEQLGKDISGAGMDPNIIGRTTKGKINNFDGPDIKRIVLLDLTEATHGNACGIGLADYITKKAKNKVDYIATYANSIASGNPEAGRIPITLDTEFEAVVAALKCCNRSDENNPKIVRIKNTLNLEYIYVSENMLPIINQSDYLELVE
ncbi:MAG: lactate racemase domain-containing protein [Bacillota bacterium]